MSVAQLELNEVLQRAKDATVLAQKVEDPDLQREIAGVADVWLRIAQRMTGAVIEAAMIQRTANSN